jgi:penicillin-binding protein 2
VVDPQGHVVQRFQPRVQSRLPVSRANLAYIDRALTGTPVSGTLAWRFTDFPLDRVPIRGKTGSAEVHGKQSTSWIASYTPDYVVVMMVSQAGTGSGTSGPAVRKIYEALYGVDGLKVRPQDAAIPGVVAPGGLPTFADDGTILPPSTAPDPTGRKRQ